MHLPRTQARQIALLVVVILIAIVGGVVVGRELLGSQAAVKTLAQSNGTFDAGRLQAQTHTGPPKGAPRVIFLGPFGHNVKGMTQCAPAVRLMEGALRKKGFRKLPAANCVGLATRRQIIAFQKSIHYKPTGVYNLATHQALAKAGGYTAEARRALNYTAHLIYVAKIQHNVLTVTSHARLVGGDTLAYSQRYPGRQYFPPWPRLPPATDCSGFVTWVLYQSGVGASVGYFGPGSSVGWTGTLGRQGVVVQANKPLHIGDIVLYGSRSTGSYPWGHVEVYIGHGQTEGHGSVGVHVHAYNYRPVGQVRRLF
jgi:hypothetical protein